MRNFWLKISWRNLKSYEKNMWENFISVPLIKRKKAHHGCWIISCIARNSRPKVFCKKWCACNFIKKEALTQVFSCEFCKISTNTSSYRTTVVAASPLWTSLLSLKCVLSHSPRTLTHFRPMFGLCRN